MTTPRSKSATSAQMVLDFWDAQSEAQKPESPPPPGRRPQIQAEPGEPASGLNLASEGPPEDVVPPGAWGDWARRPSTPQNRLDDLVMQIKRDVAVLSGDPKYFGSVGDREFYESRVAAMRKEATQIGEGIAQTTTAVCDRI